MQSTYTLEELTNHPSVDCVEKDGDNILIHIYGEGYCIDYIDELNKCLMKGSQFNTQ